MPKSQRIVLFLIYLIFIAAISFVHNGEFIPVESSYIVMYSALVMLSFIVLFVEHYFTKPTDVLSSSVAIMLLLSPVQGELSRLGIWYLIFFNYNVLLVITSLSALLLVDDNKSVDDFQNKLAMYLKRFSVRFGNGKFLFYVLFILSLLFYVDSQSDVFLVLFGFSLVILLVDPKKYYISTLKIKNSADEVGHIISVQSSNVYLANLYKNKPLKTGELVQFCFNTGSGSQQFIGTVLNVYLLDDKRWGRILKLDSEIEGNSLNIEPVSEYSVCRLVADVEELSRPIAGMVVEGSNIRKVRFHESTNGIVTEGSLLQLKCNDSNVMYQVVQGTTYTELLESKNEAGGVIGDAVQLGVWDSDKFNFIKYGWVPSVNTPLYLADDIDSVDAPDNNLNIGNIPNTNYPVLLDKETAITHHLAILGVTGMGKSVFARNLIRNIATVDTKVIVVDFTMEHGRKLSDLNPMPMVSDDKAQEIYTAIDILDFQFAQFKNNRDANAIAAAEKTIKCNFYNAIEEYLKSDEKIRMFELPDVSNSTGTLEYTKWFFKALFAIAKNEAGFGRQVCIVLEEAHTVIPEYNFVGVSDVSARSLVNSIGQIALQGRKYGIGFIIIAQRTANVSKTVLTQCNSIIAFKQFDKTSGDFLSNYIGDDMVQALPNLKFRQGIAVGKAFKANMPLIFEVPEIDEDNLSI